MTPKTPLPGMCCNWFVSQNNQNRRGTLPIREKLDRWADKADLISLALIANDYIAANEANISAISELNDLVADMRALSDDLLPADLRRRLNSDGDETDNNDDD